MMVMKKMLCEDTDWLLSEEAFSIYASCMYHPTYNDYVGLMEDYLSDTSKKVFVYEDRGKKTGLMVLKISIGWGTVIAGTAIILGGNSNKLKALPENLASFQMMTEWVEPADVPPPQHTIIAF
jgi:hypothetical protein